MTDIIFHIGFPKCASSTLQNIVFPQTKGYLGAGTKIPEKFRYAKKFQDLSPSGPSITSSLTEAKKWSKQILRLKAEEFPSVNRLILSSEAYIMHNILSHKPIIPFLKKFKEKIWKEHGDVKIIVVLRNQQELIASSYAQGSIPNPIASQNDFKRQTDYFLKKYYHKLDYSSWVKSLFENFGKENVCVLLMEDIQKIEFWNELKNFADLPEFDPISMLSGDNMANKKSISKNTWKLFDYSAPRHAKNKVNNYFNAIWPGYILPSYRLKAKKTSTQLLEKIYKKKFAQEVSNKERSFQLTNEIRSKILEAYYDSNVQLGKLIDRDLSVLGYI